jgi:predicted nucleotidyltransferase
VNIEIVDIKVYPVVNLIDLDQNIRDAIEIFTQQMIYKYEPLGIMLVGSYAKGYAGPNSDLDMYVIVEDQDWRERGNTWINDLEIEYFINPVKQVRAYFQQEDALRPNTADMLGTGIVVMQKGTIIDELISEARTILYRPLSILEGVELELARYYLDDAKKDLLDLSGDPTSFAYQQTLWQAIEICNRIVSRQYGAYQDRVKIRFAQIQSLDSKYSHILNWIVNDSSNPDRVIALIEYVEGLIGPRPKEWVLRGDLTV